MFTFWILNWWFRISEDDVCFYHYKFRFNMMIIFFELIQLKEFLILLLLYFNVKIVKKYLNLRYVSYLIQFKFRVKGISHNYLDFSEKITENWKKNVVFRINTEIIWHYNLITDSMLAPTREKNEMKSNPL